MSKTKRFTTPFAELKTDPRRTLTSEYQADFISLLHNYIQEQLKVSEDLNVLNLWILRWNPAKRAIDVSAPEPLCAGNRWLRTNWGGEALDDDMFKRFFGVISGSSEFHGTLFQLQQTARTLFAEPHPLHTVSNLSFMLQWMLAHLVTRCPHEPIKLGTLGVVTHAISERGKHALALTPGKFSAPITKTKRKKT